MTLPLLSAEQVRNKVEQSALLVDIRSAAEYAREHIDGAVNIPPEQLAGKLPEHVRCVVFHCLSGVRTRNAAQQLAAAAGRREAYILDGGLNGWKAVGLPTLLDRRQPIDLMRQVHICAGSMVLTGAILGWLVSPLFYWLCTIVGAGLLTAGLTGFCGMARLLMRMPWNAQNR